MDRRLSTVCALMLLTAVATANAQSQPSWPTKPLRMLLQSPPGGSMDLLARIVQAPVQQATGQPLVIETRTGGLGIVAHDAMLKAKDAHTLGMSATATAALPWLAKAPFDSLRDFAFISLLVKSPNLIAVNPATKINSIGDLVAAAKAKPGGLNYGHTGLATGQHIAFEALKLRTGINVVQVPYRGAGPAMVAAVAGEVPITLAAAGGMVSYVKSGKLRPVAVTGGQRLSILKDVPTVAEQGYPGFAVEEWFGVVGPAADMPPGTVARLNEAINGALKTPAVKERLESLGYEVDPMSPDEFRAFVEAETKKVGEIIKAAHITLE